MRLRDLRDEVVPVRLLTEVEFGWSGGRPVTVVLICFEFDCTSRYGVGEQLGMGLGCGGSDSAATATIDSPCSL